MAFDIRTLRELHSRALVMVNEAGLEGAPLASRLHGELSVCNAMIELIDMQGAPVHVRAWLGGRLVDVRQRAGEDRIKAMQRRCFATEGKQ